MTFVGDKGIMSWLTNMLVGSFDFSKRQIPVLIAFADLYFWILDEAAPNVLQERPVEIWLVQVRSLLGRLLRLVDDVRVRFASIIV